MGVHFEAFQWLSGGAYKVSGKAPMDFNEPNLPE